MPKALAGALEKMWTLPAKQGGILLNCPSEGDPTRASSNTGKGLLTYLTDLVSHAAKVTKGISLLSIKEYGRVTHSHSLFCVSAGEYIEPDLWGILGPLQDDGTPL